MQVLLKTKDFIYGNDHNKDKLPILLESEKINIYDIYKIGNNHYSVCIIDIKENYAIAEKLTEYTNGKDTEYTNSIKCPYCGYEDINSFEHGESGKINCGKCNSEFIFWSEITVDYFTKSIKRNEPEVLK